MLVGTRIDHKIHTLDQQGRRIKTIDPSACGAGELIGAFNLLYDPQRDRILVADTTGHRLLALDSEGKLLAQNGSSNDPTFRFPNQMFFDKTQRLWVVDTNHWRLARLDDNLQVVESIPVKSPCCIRPVTAAADEAGFVVFIADHQLEGGQVIKTNVSGETQTILPLPKNAEPFGIVVRQRDLLVADGALFTVHRFSPEGTQIEAFGDTDFEAAMATAKQEKHFYRTLGKTTKALLVLALIALLAGYFWHKHKQASAPAMVDDIPTEPMPGAVRRPALPPAPSRSATSSAMLSAIVPGLGQFFQERKLVALTFFIICGMLLLVSLKVVSVLYWKDMEINKFVGFAVIANALMVWAINVFDAYRHGKR